MDLPPDVERIVREAYREAAEEEMELMEDYAADTYGEGSCIDESANGNPDMRGPILDADIGEEDFDYWKNWENRR